MVFEHLQKEFDAVRTSQSQEIFLDGEQWNDGLLATIRERVHMEADRKVMPGDFSSGADFLEKITYKAGNKVICGLEGARIGIQYETFFAGSSSSLHAHFTAQRGKKKNKTPPKRRKQSRSYKFIDHVGELLQAYVDRREQVRLIKELYGNQILDLYNSLPFHMIEFVLDDSDCKHELLKDIGRSPLRLKCLPKPGRPLQVPGQGSALWFCQALGSMVHDLVPARTTI
ncbi:hypothetical protein CDL15_Pgr028901 [Punica granatum]|uniref:Uncharacterized protein n=1 Tax=Punica granatum TaxID=22663 RepID=A0A218WX24_PUNGR|nr:hypothetical protein CDL15_Pgr028901 [Punica granatum]